jgi:hypothetical protein
MQDVIAADYCGVGVGKDGEGVTRLVGEIARDVGGIDTDGHRKHASRRKVRQPFFYAS